MGRGGCGAGILLLTLLAVLIPATRGVANIFLLPPESFTEKLRAGGTPGTFHYECRLSIGFTQEEAFPVTVEIVDAARKAAAQVVVSNTSPFTIGADLAPGSYTITSEVSADKQETYWQVNFKSLFVGTDGNLTGNSYQAGVQETAGPEYFKKHSAGTDGTSTGNTYQRGVHLKKIKILEPALPFMAAIDEKRPLLKWAPLEGAAHYRVNWYVHQPSATHDHSEDGSSGDLDKPEYRFEKDAVPNRKYEWSVWATGTNNETLGYWSAAYFFTPGGKENVKPEYEIVRPQKGQPYIGAVVFGSENGIILLSIMQDSPALKAGLMPNDLLEDIDGLSLVGMTQRQFVETIRKLPVGKKVKVSYVRGGDMGTTTLTIGGRR